MTVRPLAMPRLHNPLAHGLLPLVCLAASSLACFSSEPGDTADGTAGTTQADGDGDPGDGDPGDGDPGDGDGDPGDGDPGEACGAGFECVPDPGPMWTGPFAIAEVGTTCLGAYPNLITELYSGLDVAPSDCACTCGAPNVTCATNMSAIGYAQLNCISGQGANQLSQNQCYNTFSSSHGVSLGNANSSCGAGTVDAQLPAPTFDAHSVVCGGGQPDTGSCEAGASCLPLPAGNFDPGVCYMAEGDQACPIGLPLASQYFSDLTDTRSCPQNCTCSATGAVCQVTVTGYANTNCTSGQGAISVASGQEECVAANSQIVRSIRPGNVTVQNAGSCSGQDLALSGEVTVSGPKTICCTG